MYFCIIASQFMALDFHLGGGGIGGLRVRPFHPLFKKSIKLEQLEILPFIFMFLKIGLADDIVLKGHLVVGKNYSKRKQLKKLSDRVLVCSR